ncbi:uncharacterized protein [Manis javanica]|uniref:uncharacterized protein isoform X2 n=1 Tax=Manis javanica TaxID=9974 RepID=UPI003C6DA9A6
MLVRLGSKRRAKCTSLGCNLRLSCWVARLADIQTRSSHLPARLWAMEAISCLREKWGVLPSVLDPPGPSVSPTAICYWIVPAEVESALAEHPVVLESAVVSSPDPTTGEVVKAFIGLSPAYSSHDPEKLTQELQEHVKRVTAPYKYPGKSQGDLCFRTAKDSFWKDPEE